MTETYKRPFWLFNAHLETIYPAIGRKVNNPPLPKRQRIKTPDGDFLDLDWMKNDHKKLVILQHGLEGSSDRPYMLGMAKVFLENGYDICAWNFRGCSGEINDKPVFYHSGATYDLDCIVNEGLKSYEDITLIGFSLGANLTLKYLGEQARDSKIKRAVALSVPLDLAAGADNLSLPKCFIYERRFLNNLLHKIRLKEHKIPGSMNLGNIRKVKSIRDFDEYFTAPLHGFEGATDYYNKNSSVNFLDGIKVPTLILNAANDPMLTGKCLDPKVAENNPQITFQITRQGGHVGFTQNNTSGYFWSEERALEFCLKH